jgi:hypothetical protein
MEQTPRSSAKRLNLIVIGMDLLGSGRTDTWMVYVQIQGRLTPRYKDG